MVVLLRLPESSCPGPLLRTRVHRGVSYVRFAGKPGICSRCGRGALDAERAVNMLGEITGETASADLAHEIFGRFCVGK